MIFSLSFKKSLEGDVVNGWLLFGVKLGLRHGKARQYGIARGSFRANACRGARGLPWVGRLLRYFEYLSVTGVSSCQVWQAGAVGCSRVQQGAVRLAADPTHPHLGNSVSFHPSHLLRSCGKFYKTCRHLYPIFELPGIWHFWGKCR